MNTVRNFIQSTFGQFLIGGTTVAGISHFSRSTNPVLAGVIAAIPVGMPSSVFVPDTRVASYATNLLIMSFSLLACTTANWYFITRLKWDKYQSVAVSLLVFFVGAGLSSLYVQTLT